jgi:hypothetical protein
MPQPRAHSGRDVVHVPKDQRVLEDVAEEGTAYPFFRLEVMRR